MILAATLVSITVAAGLAAAADPTPPSSPEPVAIAACTTGAASVADRAARPTNACTPRSECCKVCSKGAACGDTCIRRDSTCRTPRGCACDAAEVCD